MKVIFSLTTNVYNGLNSFNYTIAKSLKNSGVEVNFFFKTIYEQYKKNYEEFNNLGKCYVEMPPPDMYDMCFINSNEFLDTVRTINAREYRYIVHGLMDDIFKIPEMDFSRVYCLSETSLNFIETDVQKVLVRQPIDVEKFQSLRPINKELKNVLVLDSRYANAMIHGPIIAAASSLGASTILLGKNEYCDTHKPDVENYINEADLVIGYGRSCYEAMSCGRNVIIYGINGGEGFVTGSNFYNSRTRNCSGWFNKTIPSIKRVDIKTCYNAVLGEMKKYNQDQGLKNREMILKDHSSDIISKMMIE